MSTLLKIDPSIVCSRNMGYEEHTVLKKNGKVRKIVNPSPDLKKYQRSRLGKLYRVFRKLAGTLDSNFHGFVPKRNSITAATFHVPYSSTTMYDFANFFDTVTPEHITTSGLELSSTDLQYLFHKDGYTAQGFPSSPMLANIAVIPFIRDLNDYLKDFTGKGNFALTIYADDIQISTYFGDKELWEQIDDYVESLAKEHNFTINPNKTRIRHAKHGARRILGVNVTPTGIEPTRKTNRKVRAVRQQVNNKVPKGQVLGGLRAWQECHYPKGVDYIL